MDKLRFKQLKAFVQLDNQISHDMPQLYFNLADLRWLFEKVERAEYLEKILRMIAENMNEKEFSELIKLASKALEDSTQ